MSKKDDIDPKLYMDGKTVKDMPTPRTDIANNSPYEETAGCVSAEEDMKPVEQELQFLKGLLAEYLQYASTDGNPKRQVLRAKLKELIK
jgi:hypothetical protein